ATGSAPAERVSKASSSRLASKSPLPKSMPTSTARVLGSVVCRDSLRSSVSISVGLNIQIDGTCGDHGRNGMLVNHLGHGIAQQYDILIEGFNMALQFDAIYQVNRDRNMLFAQCIE